MAYRLIYSEFWTDPKVMEELTPEDRYFYLFLLTNPATTSCGIYMITKKQIAFQLGYSTESVNSLMDRFEKQHKLIIYNTETRELAIRNWGKYNLSRGGKPVLDCISSELSKVKDKNLINYVRNNISNQAMSDLYLYYYDKDAYRERAVIGSGDNTDTDTYTDTDTNTSKNTNTSTSTSKDTNTSTSKDRNTRTDANARTYTNAGTDTNIVTDIPKNEAIDEISITEENTGKEEVHNHSLSLIMEYEKLTGQIGILNVAAVKLAVLQHGKDNVKKAINKALEKGKLNMSYVNGILRTWAKEGYPKEGEENAKRDPCKSDGTGKFTGIKPPEPRTLTEDEGKSIEEELL